MHYLIALLVGFLVLGIASPSFGQSVLTNGDFSTKLDGWTKTGDGVFFKAEDGKSFVRLQTDKPQLVQLSQTITVPRRRASVRDVLSRALRRDAGKREWSDGRTILTFWLPEKTIKWHPEHTAFDGKSDGWQTITRQFTVPKGRGEVRDRSHAVVPG